MGGPVGSVSRAAEPLVGRARELDALVKLLSGDTPLLTLTGPVGVGKSALAREVARRLTQTEQVGGVRWCDASQAENASSALDLLAEALDVPATSAAIASALETRGSLLIVLDGVDGWDGEARAELRSWVGAGCCRWLVTARGRLSLPEEVVYALEPLPTPAGDELAGAAAELFVARVRRVRPEYAPTPGEAACAAELCRELDGLPLALELAAPRLGVMGPAALLHRLRSSRSILASGGGSGQRDTLESALDGAWQALELQEREALTCLTVFEGGFLLDAAEAVIGPTSTAETRAIDVVARLRDRSLLMARPVDALDGELRLSLLRAVRDFVRRRGDAEVLGAARDRHATWYSSQAARWHLAARTARGNKDRARLAGEHGNLLAVIEGVLGGGPVTARRAEPALRALIALFPPHGAPPPARYLAVLGPTLTATRDSGADPELVGRALVISGRVLGQSGDAAGALRELSRALHLAVTFGAHALEGEAHLALAEALASQGELEPARAHATTALERFVSCGARLLESAALTRLARIEQARGEGSAAALVDRALALGQSLGDPGAEVQARLGLASLALDQGRHAEALAELERARARCSEDVSGLLECDLLAAWANHDAGELDRAQVGYESVGGRARERGLGSVEGLALGWLGALHLERDQPALAHAALRAAFDAAPARELGSSAASLAGLAAALDRAAGSVAGSAPPPAPRKALGSGPERALGRLAARALGRGLAARTRATWPPDCLIVGARGSWFRMPGAEMVSLERRKPLARLLERLAKERLQAPGAAFGWDVLLAAGWPDERVLASAGAHRVRVAVSTLRKLGLTALVTRDSGYLLDAELPLVSEQKSEHSASAHGALD